MSEGFTIRRKLIFSLLPLLAIVVAAEIAFRVVGVRRPARPAIVARHIDIDVEFPFMRADRELFWSLVPGFRGEFWDRPVTINQLAMRGPELQSPKSPERKRVVFFGDSITFGYGVGDDETYAHLFGERVESLGVEAVNAGVTGFTSFQVSRWLQRLAPDLAADIAVFCIGWNDSTLRTTNDRGYARRMWVATAGRWLTDYSYIYRAAMGAYLRSLDGERKQERTVNRVSLADYEANLEAIIAFCRQREITPVFIDLPRRKRAGVVHEPPPYRGAMSAVASAADVPVVSAFDLGFQTTLESNAHYFIDSLHFSPEGHAYLAARLEEALVRLGLL